MSLGSDSGNPTGLGSALTLTPEQQAAIQQRSVAFNNAVAPAAFAPNINNFPSYQSQAATQGTINPQPATYTSPIYVPQMTQAPQLPGNPNIFYSPLGAQQYGAGLGFVTHAPKVGVPLSPEALAAQQAAAAAAYANTPAGRAAAAAAAAKAGGAGGANGANGGNAANNNGVSTGSGWGGMEGGGGDGIGSDSDDGATGDNGAEGVDSDAAAAAAASDSDSDSDSDGASDGDGGGDGGGE